MRNIYFLTESQVVRFRGKTLNGVYTEICASRIKKEAEIILEFFANQKLTLNKPTKKTK